MQITFCRISDISSIRNSNYNCARCQTWSRIVDSTWPRWFPCKPDITSNNWPNYDTI